ncbi:transglycosylase SLT domain protein [Prevotella sp. DNF00663]|uniref:transglycosylase SLT domain-containing protein n=1 Tax=Prevotella sp. DNF00663 TaxID=1384078 RepID=UPI0007841D1F|nr:transglycosylase SLT domain-containing protein [Prevotella sp. DNF00663]KXB85149.1 transglycosylase SLT domain protein [Prevotella sp. DNF00663]
MVYTLTNSKLKYALFILVTLCLIFASCQEAKKPELTPWGTVLGGDTATVSSSLTFSDMVNNGELIMLTLSGPETYYDYHGRGMGSQYLLCEKFAENIGVSLRVEVCKDTAELVSRLKSGDGDLVAFQLPETYRGIVYCGARVDSAKTQWAVREDSRELADTLNRWFRPELLTEVKREEDFALSTRSVVRRVYSPMLNRSGGIISHYDVHFRRYAPICRWDWRLLAAQCYQESTFDPQARSWAGACGLMQIMPGTASHLGLPQSQIFEPEANIAAACKYIAELRQRFNDVRNPMEQSLFVLAAYNGGFFHIRDAMALARKYGRNPYSWGDVREFVLKLSTPAYYSDAVVKYGYMRGLETVDYVDRIRMRWAQYRGVAGGGISMGGMSIGATPKKAKRRNRFQI